MAGPTYKALFNKFRDDTVINKCKQYAHWTLPYLMADQLEVSATGRVVVERDFQEIGALFTNGLSSKLTRLLFPTQYPFFQASASKEFKEKAASKGIDEVGLRALFSRMETAANKRLFLNAGYASLNLALRHLIVTGNVLLHRDSEKACVTSYGLQQFAVRRDGTGNLLDCILREYTTVEALPQILQVALRQAAPAKYGRAEQTVEKYTRIHRTYHNGVEGYEVSQQVDSLPVGDASWYPKNLCPWLCPTWVLIPGEHYGRGHVEDFAGGFAKLSTMSEASALYGVEIMRVVHLVGAGAGSNVDELAESESGEWVRGDPDQVGVHEAGDAGKMQAVEASIESTIMRLAKAFMYQGSTRDAERVTAFELQLDAQEADYTLGGVHSTLSGSTQIPLAHILMTEVSDDALAGIISGHLSPDITAGIPALGRSSDVQNLLQAAQELTAVIPVVQLDERIDPKKVVDMVFGGRSIDTEALYHSPEKLKQIQEANAQVQQGQDGLVAADTLANSGAAITETLTGA